MVYIGSQCFWSSAVLFQPAGNQVVLNAYPYPGYVFTGWALNSAAPSPFLTQLTLTEPIDITPYFEPGKLVSFLTAPVGLDLLIDHTQVHTRTINDVPACPSNETQPLVVPTGFPSVCFGDFYFAPGSTHFISGVSPQRDNTGKWWVFNDWSNGQAPNSIYNVANNITPVVLTGNYLPGAQVAFLTSPNGLQVERGWAQLAFLRLHMGVGNHAPSLGGGHASRRERTAIHFSELVQRRQRFPDVHGRPNGRQQWVRDDGKLQRIDRLVVQSSPTGLTVQVDGANCVTPCNVDRPSGTTVHVTAPTQIPMGQGTRLDFGSWSDGGASDHTVTVSQNSVTLTASYRSFYQLSASSNSGQRLGIQVLAVF